MAKNLSEDAQLVVDAKQDPRRFGALYKKYYEQIYRYCYYRVNRSKDLTEDIVGDVFIKALENIASYEDRGTPYVAWLYTIARNLIIDHFKSGKVKYHGSSAPLDWAAGDHDVAKEIEKKDGITIMGEAIKSLPPDAQELVTLKLTSELSFKEIGQTLGINEGAAKMRYYRILEKVRTILEKSDF